MGSLFGGKQASSSTKNVNNPLLLGSLTGTLNQTGQASDAISRLLGLGGDPSAQQAGFNTWKNNTGYQFGLDQGLQAITGNRAASGLLNSGSTLKALNQYGQDYGSSKFGDYLSQLFNLGNLGLGAGGILASSGVKSKNTSAKPGLLQIGANAAASAAASGAGG